MTPHYVSEHLASYDLRGSWVLTVDAPLGRGKTRACQELAAKYERVLVITDSRALTRAAAASYGCAYYEDVKTGDCPAKLCTTTHSAWKFQPEEPWDLVIVEEAAGVRSAWTSKTCKGVSWTTKEATLNHCANSARVVIQSADLTESEKQWWIDAVSKRCDSRELLDLTVAPELGTREIKVARENVVNQRFLEAIESHKAGDPTIFMACTSDQWTQAKIRELQTLRPDLKIGGVSKSNSMTHETQALLADPSKIEAHDVWIYSPSIKGGVSFDSPCTAVFGRFTGGCTPRDFAQMLLRARNPENKEIWLSVTNSAGEYQTDARYLRGLALGIHSKTNTLVDSHMITASKDYQTGEVQPHDPELLDSWVLSETESRRAKNNRLKEFVQTCHRHGWDVSNKLEEELDEETQAANRETYKEAKDEVEAEYVEAVVSAPELSEDEAEELEKKITKTPEEREAQIKHNIDWFYGQKGVTPELVETDKRGKYRRRVRQYAALTLWQSGDQLAVVLDDLRARTKQAVECKHNILRVQLQDKIMRLGLGSDISESEGTTITSATLEDRLSDWLGEETNRAQVREFIGSSCTAQTAEKPVQWFLAQLRTLGATVTSKQLRVDGERQREYTISWEQVSDLATAEMERKTNASLEAQGVLVLKKWEPTEGDLTDSDVERMLAALAA